MNKLNKGFAHVVILIVIVIALSGGTALYVVNKSDPKTKTEPEKIIVNNPDPEIKAESKEKVSTAKSDLQQLYNKCLSRPQYQVDAFKEFAEAICYTEIAEKQNDRSICDNISTGELKSQCRSKFSQTSVTECENAASKHGCIVSLAKLQKNYLICDNITEKDGILFRGNCYSQVAQVLKDESICKKITNNNDALGYCYTGLAKIKKMPPLCENVIDTNQITKKYCYELAQ